MTYQRGPLPAPQLAEVSFFAQGHAIKLLLDQGLLDACGLLAAFTGRAGGVSGAPYTSFNLGDHVGDQPACVSANRQLLLEAAGVDAADAPALVNPKQVHGIELVELGPQLSEDRARAREGADGIVCTRAGVPVLLCFADCVPVIAAAPGGAFAVLHAGWRGALAGIPAKGLDALARAAGCEAGECNLYIGPHIGPCCYETSQEILDRFTAAFGPCCDAGGRHLDLAAAVRASLLQAGANPERITHAGRCTSCCNAEFFSYRADGGTTGRHGALCYLKKEVTTQ